MITTVQRKCRGSAEKVRKKCNGSKGKEMNFFRVSGRSSRGVTLTELLVGLAILGIISAVTGTLMTGGIKFFRLTTAKGEIQRDVRQSIDLINRNLRQGLADTVTITRFNTTQPPCSMIVFTHINGNDMRFYQLNDKIYSGTTPAGTTNWNDSLVAGNLRGLLFAYPCTSDDTILSVSICFEKSTYQGSSKTLQLSVEKIRIMNNSTPT